MELDLSKTALVVIDPQIDFLSPQGVAWPFVGECVTENRVVENLERLFAAAKQAGLTIAVSPHHERVMHDIRMFKRYGPLTLDGFAESGVVGISHAHLL